MATARWQLRLQRPVGIGIRDRHHLAGGSGTRSTRNAIVSKQLLPITTADELFPSHAEMEHP